MDNKEVFNKAEFAALLDKAKGNRSINQYAGETGVSAAHISRFLREMIEAPPTPETISKLSAKAYNEVTYQDLMIAAGHLSRQYDNNIIDDKVHSTVHESDSITKDSPINYRNEIEAIRNRFKQILLADLYDKPFNWSPEKLEGKISCIDMILNLQDSEYKRWYFDFKPVKDNRSFLTFDFYSVYGRIAAIKIYPDDKFTIVVNNEEVFHYFLNRPPLSLRANLYVMLIDLDEGKIIKEEQLCKY